MNCEEFGRCLDRYEELTDAEKCAMAEHTAVCEECGREMDFFLSMMATVKSLPKIQPPADFMDTLGARLDAEDIKIARTPVALHNVRANLRRYVTIAACFALVAVITANRGVLLDTAEVSDNGVITETTVDNAEVDAPIPEITPAAIAAAKSESIPAAVRVSPRRTGAVSPSAMPSANVSREVQTVSETAATAVPSARARIAEPEQEIEGLGSIALAGTIMRATDSESAKYDLKPEEVSASLRASRIIDSYSMASGSESIAIGRYYSVDDSRNPIMHDDEESRAKAVGTLRVSRDDREAVMDILNRYPYDEKGNVYTTGRDNVSEMLSDMRNEGIYYADYIVGGSNEVKFKLEFE